MKNNKKATQRSNAEGQKTVRPCMENVPSCTTPLLVTQAPALPPLAAKLGRLALALSEHSHKLSAEEWGHLRIVRRNIMAVALQVAAMENHFEVPHEIA